MIYPTGQGFWMILSRKRSMKMLIEEVRQIRLKMKKVFLVKERVRSSSLKGKLKGALPRMGRRKN